MERRSDTELPGGREREGAGSEQEVGEEGKEGEGEARLPAELKDVGLQVGQGAQRRLSEGC